MTVENWNIILYTAMRSGVHPAITTIYMISWIFIGNFVFLNLFLAILLDEFGNEEEVVSNDEETKLNALFEIETDKKAPIIITKMPETASEFNKQ
jgi:hypothetical protein